MVGIAAILVGALVVFLFLPARAGDVRESIMGPLDGLASLTYAEAESVLERDTAEELGLLDPAEGGGHGRAEGSLEPVSRASGGSGPERED